MKLRYYGSCVGWKRSDVHAEGGLSDMIHNARDITRRTFLKYADADDLLAIEEALGYETHWKKGLTMAGDFHVSYHRSKLHGKTVYFFTHSAIEHVFHNS